MTGFQPGKRGGSRKARPGRVSDAHFNAVQDGHNSRQEHVKDLVELKYCWGINAVILGGPWGIPLAENISKQRVKGLIYNNYVLGRGLEVAKKFKYYMLSSFHAGQVFKHFFRPGPSRKFRKVQAGIMAFGYARSERWYFYVYVPGIPWTGFAFGRGVGGFMGQLHQFDYFTVGVFVEVVA